ncbi:MAG: RidA family protein [Betaproteobacteria bacterium]|nr:MAG: RidA family protein [Betaproteobacteria bacterium]TAN54591.1 MAG: RidA family protein [Betaproteobacteria bacterium]
MQILQPPGWTRPKGYSNGIAVRGGKTVYIAGQVGWTAEGIFAEKSFGGQFKQALANILAVLAQAGGRPEHIVRMTWYVVDRGEYFRALGEVGAAYRALIGRHYPVMTVIEVRGLVGAEARLEIEATAVVPD